MSEEGTAQKGTGAGDAVAGRGSPGHGFGTLPVFLAGISTILGAIMFLRFGYAVGHAGLLGALWIVVLGHLVTIPTALALAEIATNRKVEGGGEYFIISRSFGTTIGGVIGISLYLSQAISVAFYMIAFAEAFSPMAGWFQSVTGIAFDPRFVSIPATLLLLSLVLTKGAAMGVKALYVVVATLAASLVLFFLGSPVEGFDPDRVALTQTITNPDPFIIVFAIVFPGFTGMTAGVGLSGDLRDPKKSIPRGTIGATLVGMAIYVLIILKLAYSAPSELLGTDQLVMAQIAVWGPMILIGLGAATLSSAIGSVLVAPRTLQALAADRTFPLADLNERLASGVGAVNEPRFATLVTGAIALLIVLLGNVDAVARLISMFFMVTYGALCAISFLEHFAARPSYRPSFKSRWYISLFGALMCLLMMLQMDLLFALLAIVFMAGIYWLLTRSRPGENDLGAMFQGVMTQLTRYLHIRLQETRASRTADEWRPSILMVNGRTFDRRSPMVFLRWLCHRHGFGTYLHYIQGNLNNTTYRQGERTRKKLVDLARVQKSSVYLDTIVSPSMTSALAQSLQIPGVSGLNNNAILFEFAQDDPPEVLDDLIKHARFASHANVDILVLRHGDWHFGECRNIHIWLTWNDQSNANLMILLSYILLGHPDWNDAEISVSAALPKEQLADQRTELKKLMAEGRLPVSAKNLKFYPTKDQASFHRLVSRISTDADLTVVGFDQDGLIKRPQEVFTNHPSLRDVLFVHTSDVIEME